MPEGPEIRMNSMFINSICNGKTFNGRPEKSLVHKNSAIPFTSGGYTICSNCRGKELSLTLQCQENPSNHTRILFRFGMTGKIVFTCEEDVPKHAHLKFFTVCEGERYVLSFVDSRRFGSWQMIDDGWGEKRGPDIIDEYAAFRMNIFENLQQSVFRQPICECLLNQEYFNGIGNYLRAEILYRAGISPFVSANSVLEPLRMERGDQVNDLLRLCRDIQLEVIQLKSTSQVLSDGNKSKYDHEAFSRWLKCYMKPGMSSAKDRQGRRIWYQSKVLSGGASFLKRQRMKRSRDEDDQNPTPKKQIRESCKDDQIRQKARTRQVLVRRSERIKAKVNPMD